MSTTGLAHGNFAWHSFDCDCETCTASDAAFLASPEGRALALETGPGPCEGCERPGTAPINARPGAPRICDDCWTGPRAEADALRRRV